MPGSTESPRSEKVSPSVAVMMDKERHLKFTLGAMIRFKEATGKDLRKKEVAASLEKEIELEDLRAIIWACLYHEDKELTLEAVGDIIELGNMPEIAARLSEAIKNAMPAPPKGGSEGKPPLARKK